MTRQHLFHRRCGQLARLRDWEAAGDALRTWISLNPGRSDIPTELVEALVQADQAIQAGRTPTSGPQRAQAESGG